MKVRKLSEDNGRISSKVNQEGAQLFVITCLPDAKRCP